MRREPNRWWDADAMGRRLYTTPAQAAEVLIRLASEGLATSSEQVFRYVAASDHAQSIDRLAEAYANNLIGVTNLIHGKTPRIRQFADAFKLRRPN